MVVVVVVVVVVVRGSLVAFSVRNQLELSTLYLTVSQKQDSAIG